MLTLTRTFHFAASHVLTRPDWDAVKNRAVFGKCANLHGHNYQLEVEVCGEADSETGMLIHATELRQMVEELIISQLDHKHLNDDVPWLKGKITTGEVIIDEIWKQLEPAFINHGKARLSQLRLWETPNFFVTRRAVGVSHG